MLNPAKNGALLAVGRYLSTRPSLQHASPAVATGGSKGFLSSLFGGGDRVMVPLTDPLPGVVLPEYATPPAKAPKTDMTTLSNGFKVASENTLVR